MAPIATAYIGTAYMIMSIPGERAVAGHARVQAMAYIVMACIVMAYIVMACIVMACIVMAYIVMACIVMACIVMASSTSKPPRLGHRLNRRSATVA